MNYYCLPNLTSTAVKELDPRKPLNEDATFANKAAFSTWAKATTTDHCFYSLCSGAAPKNRVGKGNPIHKIQGLVVDYDAPVGDVEAGIQRVREVLPKELLPRFFHKTFSGYCRLIFEFENPILYYGPKTMEALVKNLIKGLSLNKLFAGLDATALSNWHQYYEQGTDWVEVSDTVISTDYLTTWIEEASKRSPYEGGDVVIPIEKIREEGEKQFPGAIDWKNLEEGMRCHRFWDGQADSQSVIIRDTGCTCFTGDVAFMSWGAIFGMAFVNKFRDTVLSIAIKGWYYDGKTYWQKSVRGWEDLGKQDTEAFLEGMRGLDNKRSNGMSQVSSAMVMLRDQQRITGAFPFLYRNNEVIVEGDEAWLNISRVKCVQPVDGEVKWGEGFPHIAQFLSTVFEPYNQLHFFLSWLHHFYGGAVNHDLSSGLTLIIAGPAGAGKNYLTDAIIGQMMGGVAPAEAHIVDGEQYNSQLFPFPVWTCHDAVSPSDFKSHARFSQMVKKVAANRDMSFRAMRKDPKRRQWLGRAVITLNDDPNSLALLPQTDNNILDKIAILHVQEPTIDKFLTNEAIRDELPYFGRYVIDHGIHKDHVGSARFGVQPYHQEELLETAKQESPVAVFEERLYIFRKRWAEDSWSGSSAELADDMSMIGEGTTNTRTGGSPVALGRHLNSLIKRDCGYVRKETTTGNRRVYFIDCKV